MENTASSIAPLSLIFITNKSAYPFTGLRPTKPDVFNISRPLWDVTSRNLNPGMHY